MNLSSRWCVTAVVAFGALGCSDPVPPAPQGAFIANVRSVSPSPANKTCPSGAALTYDGPAVDPTYINPQTNNVETLTANRYVHKLIDGQDGANVSCSVKGSSTFEFSGRLQIGSRAFEVSSGTIGADKTGTARVTLTKGDTPGFSHPLSAPSANCAIAVVNGGPKNEPQIKGGSMWASFSCTSVEAEPSDYCKADGFFVLENCTQ